MKKKISSKETWWSCDGHRVMSVQTFGITCWSEGSFGRLQQEAPRLLISASSAGRLQMIPACLSTGLISFKSFKNVYENKKKSWYWTRFSVIFSPLILLQFTTTLFFIFQIDLKLLCVIGLFQQKMENINMFKLNI